MAVTAGVTVQLTVVLPCAPPEVVAGRKPVATPTDLTFNEFSSG